MVDNQNQRSVSFSKKSVRTQGTGVLDILVIVIVILTVFGFMLTMVFGGGNDSGATNTGNNTTARSAPVSSTNPYPYNQPATTFNQPSFSQNPVQGRSGLSSIASDINAGNTGRATTGLGTTGLAGVAGGIAASQANQQVNPQINAQINAQQNTGTYGIGLNGDVIGLNPIQPLATPYIPTTAPTALVTGRSTVTPQSNPAVPYAGYSNNGNNAAIYIDSPQAYRPQNQELVMNQACVNEVWQRNPYVIRTFSNLSVRLSATNPTTNGNMRTYSFNLDNRPTGNGALCTVTNDGYVTAVSFY